MEGERRVSMLASCLLTFVGDALTHPGACPPHVCALLHAARLFIDIF